MQALVRNVRRSYARLLSVTFALPAITITIRVRRAVAALLIAVLLTPSLAHASPRPLDPGTVHVKVLKRGIGNFIAIQLADGIQLYGRILAAGDHSFTLQLHNDPQPTEIFYADVAYLSNSGFTTGQKLFLIGGIAAAAGVTAWGIVQFHNAENKKLTPPTLPTPPIP